LQLPCLFPTAVPVEAAGSTGGYSGSGHLILRKNFLELLDMACLTRGRLNSTASKRPTSPPKENLMFDDDDDFGFIRTDEFSDDTMNLMKELGI